MAEHRFYRVRQLLRRAFVLYLRRDYVPRAITEERTPLRSEMDFARDFETSLFLHKDSLPYQFVHITAFY